MSSWNKLPPDHPKSDSVGEDWESLFSKDNELYNIGTSAHSLIRACRTSYWLKEILAHGIPGGIMPDMKVLEAGCANAKRTIAISTYGPRCVGLDFTKAMCETAFRLYQESKTFFEKMDVEIVQGNILDLPFENDSFDLVFNNGVLEHFLDPKDRIQALKEMVRITRPLGRVLVTVPNGQHILERIWHNNLIREDSVLEATISKQDLECELKEAGLRIAWTGYLGITESFYQWLKYKFMRIPILTIDFLIRKFCPSSLKRFFAFHLICVGIKS